MHWYALFVEAGKEELVQTLINKYIDEPTVRTLVPKRKLCEKRKGEFFHIDKPLFPGYVLIHTQMNNAIYYKLKKIPKYYRLLNMYKNNETNKQINKREVHDTEQKHLEPTYLFSEISDNEMSLVLQLLGDEQVIDYSRVYFINSKVIVQSGPLKGKEAIIKKVNKQKKRVKILLNFMGNEIAMDVGIELLSPREYIDPTGP